MQTRRWVVPAVLSMAVGWVLAQEAAPPPAAGGLRVEGAVIARAVEGREPVGAATSFSSDVGRVFCFSRILGAEGETVVYHLWRHGPTERARVRLPVRSSSWRTWSSKGIVPGWTGPWTVDVLDAEGNVLETVRFTIEGGVGTSTGPGS